MKPLIVLLALCLSAHAKIGETSAQAVARLGAPAKRQIYGLKKHGTLTWERAGLTTEITFDDNGKSTEERHWRNGPLESAELNKILAAAAPGQWTGTGGDTFGGIIAGSMYLNGAIVAKAQKRFGAFGVELVISEDPELVAAAAERKDIQSDLEKTKAEIAKFEAEKAARLAAAIAERKKERTSGTYRLVGKVAAIYPDGLLLQGDSKLADFHAKVLITGHPDEKRATDGFSIVARVKPAGTFEIKGDAGAMIRVHKLQFVSELPVETLRLDEATK